MQVEGSSSTVMKGWRPMQVTMWTLGPEFNGAPVSCLPKWGFVFCFCPLCSRWTRLSMKGERKWISLGDMWVGMRAWPTWPLSKTRASWKRGSEELRGHFGNSVETGKQDYMVSLKCKTVRFSPTELSSTSAGPRGTRIMAGVGGIDTARWWRKTENDIERRIEVIGQGHHTG